MDGGVDGGRVVWMGGWGGWREGVDEGWGGWWRGRMEGSRMEGGLGRGRRREVAGQGVRFVTVRCLGDRTVRFGSVSVP